MGAKGCLKCEKKKSEKTSKQFTEQKQIQRLSDKLTNYNKDIRRREDKTFKKIRKMKDAFTAATLRKTPTRDSKEGRRIPPENLLK
jgi:hypothetical protein